MGTPLLTDLVVERDPPPNRRGKSDGDKEQHLTEAAVMLAFAMHLFEAHPDLRHVELHPDGEHGKGFDIRRWLAAQGFRLERSLGGTSYGGLYRRGDSSILVQIRPGLGDVVAEADGQKIVAECKGGVINTRHAGQLSRLRRGLCEAVGLLMVRGPEGERHVAVVPNTSETARLAGRMRSRCHAAGIEIALVEATGAISYAAA